jgi:hypothetical protein
MVKDRSLGPVGTLARLVVGGAFIALVALSPEWWASEGPLWLDVLVGLGVLPASLLVIQGVRMRFTTERLEATNQLAFCLNLAAGAALLAVDYTRDATALFFGTGMILAGVRSYAGCEVLAISNTVLDRDDQVGCLIFSPIDQIEARIGARTSVR